MNKRPKVLYAIQGTGNGHVARAREIIPILQKYGDLDILLSGDQSEVDLPVKPKYRSKGLTFMYNKKGGVSYPRTFIKNNFLRIIKEMWNLPVMDYDIVINDFEFTTAWACKMKNKACIGMGHQVSFLSTKSPRPTKLDRIGELVLKYYAPCSQKIAFHFDEFDEFIYKPVIRSEIRNSHTSDKGHYTVYLPAFGDDQIHELLSTINSVEWQVFSKKAKVAYSRDNVNFIPAGNKPFIESFVSCHGIFTSAGFETPAEALFMGKKLLVMPIKNQYEQYCNAAALQALGIPSIERLDQKGIHILQQWVLEDKPLNIKYPNHTEDVIFEEIFRPFQISQRLKLLTYN